MFVRQAKSKDNRHSRTRLLHRGVFCSRSELPESLVIRGETRRQSRTNCQFCSNGVGPTDSCRRRIQCRMNKLAFLSDGVSPRTAMAAVWFRRLRNQVVAASLDRTTGTSIQLAWSDLPSKRESSANRRCPWKR
jgi:hypothetical protein